MPVLLQGKSETDNVFREFKEQWVLVFRRRGNVSQGWVFIFWNGMVSFGVSFPFSHHRTPAVAICFGAEAFLLWEEEEERSKVTWYFLIENLK